jgi:hypothetical protein
MPPLSEKIEVLELVRKEKNCTLRLPRSEKNLLSVKIVKKEKQSVLVLLLHPRLQKL